MDQYRPGADQQSQTKAKRKDDFIEALLQTHLERPPYFRKMEKLNLQGEPILSTIPVPRPLSPRDFADLVDDAQIVDTRMELGFAAAHVPNAQFIWLNGLASFAGWFLIALPCKIT